MNEFNKPEHAYLIRVLSPAALNPSENSKIIDFLLERPDGATYAEIKERYWNYFELPTNMLELMKAGLVNCFDEGGNNIPVVIDQNNESYVPEKEVCAPNNSFKASCFARDFIEFLDKNNTSLSRFPQ